MTIIKTRAHIYQMPVMCRSCNGVSHYTTVLVVPDKQFDIDLSGVCPTNKMWNDAVVEIKIMSINGETIDDNC